MTDNIVTVVIAVYSELYHEPISKHCGYYDCMYQKFCTLILALNSLSIYIFMYIFVLSVHAHDRNHLTKNDDTNKPKSRMKRKKKQAFLFENAHS